MTFDPLKFGLIENAGPTPSRTVFYTEQSILNVVSNGIPYPALADSTSVDTQDYNFSFSYRAGTNTSAPQATGTGTLGIFANGVVLKEDISSSQIPRTKETAPVNFKFNKIHFSTLYGSDQYGGFEENGVYSYKSGQFVTEAWNTSLVHGSSVYYQTGNYNGDKLRHPDGHSKILGFCFDGYPIYGPYGYLAGTDANSGIKRIESGYIKLGNDKHRPSKFKYDTVLSHPEGDITLEAGSFLEDYVYKKYKGELDEHNGRYCVTPDFPEGTYAYFLTFEDDALTTPAYPYVVGPSTKQNRSLYEPIVSAPAVIEDLWSVPTGRRITTLIERSIVEISLPLANYEGIEIEIISGSIPTGTRIEGNKIVGTVYEVAYNRTFTSVIRATYNDIFQDRTIEIAVTGPDDPEWQTNPGLVPLGANSNLYILDNELVDFQFEATDTDLSAGDELSYFIANGDGVLPPGLELSEEGRLTGIVEPLLSLDKRYQAGGYDSAPFGGLPMDYATLSSNGFASFYYDTQTFDYNEPTANPRKLNRYYPIAITVTDGDSFVRREFKIYVVGDDYLKADNTIMQAGTGIFKADATHVRTPTWLTPKDLGFKRANNYTTIFLDVIDNPTLEGLMTFTLESTNDDGTTSELPPGLELDRNSGELVGYIPYQPAITTEYNFTIRATRITTDLDIAEIFGTFYEDTLLGKSSFKIYKTDLTSDDNVNDLFELVGRDILLENRLYKVINVDSRNEDYDIIFLDQTLAPSINLVASRTSVIGNDYLFIQRLTEKQKEKYTQSVLRFEENETYTVTSITPYIEYEITQTDAENDDIYPAGSPRDIEVNENYFVGDYVVYTPETGGNGFIYKCTVSHNTTPQLDLSGNIVFDDEGNIQIDFQTANWTQVAETLDELSESDRITATIQALEAEYKGEVFIDVLENNRWRIKIPSTATSRIISNIRGFFKTGTDSGEVKVTLLRDNEDFIRFDKNLTRQLSRGNNYGIALFAKDYFSENIVVAANDEVDIPSTTRTFTLKVIGEIDSAISWITPADLGSLNANFPSNLKVVAETTVPDTSMIYTVKSGSLPNGLTLRYDGEIIGAARQFENDEGDGLTTFEGKAVSWDGVLPGDTTFDRTFRFTVEARDRFNYTAIEREFTLKIEDLDATQYTSIYMRPMLKDSEREVFRNFISNSDIFEPSKIYRLGDPDFGIQNKLDMLVYAGIEAKDIQEFVAAAAKNHKRKKYIVGEFKTAIAKETASDDVIYEVVYLEVIDPAESSKGKTSNKFRIDTKNRITVDSLQYSARDDVTKQGAGYDALAVYGRGGYVRFIIAENDELVIETREGDIELNVDDSDFELELFDTSNLTITLEKSDSEPQRIRPNPTNTIKADSNAIKVSQDGDNIRYRSSIEHMRDNIESIGKKERNYLPLWMRTPQEGFQELDYVTAIPICYCKPGESATIIKNIEDSGFNQKSINYDIDRYIVRQTENSQSEQFIMFANYQFNV